MPQGCNEEKEEFQVFVISKGKTVIAQEILDVLLNLEIVMWATDDHIHVPEPYFRGFNTKRKGEIKRLK